jgi:hypothetical protein
LVATVFRPGTTDRGSRRKVKSAGAALPPSKSRTGPASPGARSARRDDGLSF